jgi:eukaryotic-like serine/threonine-protein kinase
MTPEDDRRIADIFEQAVDLPPAERSDFIARACGDDATVRREVEALLALDAEVAAEAGSPSWSLSASGALGATGRVGPYRLVSKLGEGGMSEVFLGLRDDGEFVRRVAIKLIRRDVLTAETTRRFETERQILASLDHPAIAKLLDAGRTADGVPYFIMEYIEGERIDSYCDRHRLTIAERLEIFRQVCLAVHFAHQNLVIHRDIKPSNILVTEAGQPKLLDFGIAKLLNPDLLARGGEPTVWGRPLTPEYASPEQILGRPVTSASDVYALGVLLFKLLTGADPYRLRERPAAELEESILTVEPDAPSAFVRRLLDSQDSDASEQAMCLAVQRGTQPQALVRALAGDLDAVTAKALRKEPQHRYVSAEEMAEDMRRHLAGGQVLAPHGTASLPWAGLRRLRRRWVTAAAVLVLLLLTAVGALVLQRVRLIEARARAERDQARAEEIVASMERTFEEMSLGLAQGRKVASRDLIDHAARRFQQDLAGQPETQANLLMALGRIYFWMGLSEETDFSIQTALAIRQRLFGPEHETVAECLETLALADFSHGRPKDAEHLYAKALAIRRKTHPRDDLAVTESLVGLGRTKLALGYAAAAEPLLQEALIARGRLLNPWDVRIAETLTDLGHTVGRLESPSAAEILFLRAALIQQRASGNESWEVANNLIHAAAARFEQGKREAGRELLQEVPRIENRLCDDASPDLASSLLNVAAAAQRGTPWRQFAVNLGPTASVCRMPPLAVPHLFYLLRGVGIGLSELGYEAEASPVLRLVGEVHSPAIPPLPLVPDSSRATGACVSDGGFAETSKQTCCSGVIAGGTTVCRHPEDWGTTWRTCRHVCGSRLVNGCVPSGGITDTLSLTKCCGASVNGSTRCLNPADEDTTWRTCVHTCA